MNQPKIIKNVLSFEQCSLLSDYIRLKANARPNVINNHDPLHGVHREYGDALLETWLQRLTPLIEQETGLALWPTLSFYYLYKKGNELARHKDRSSCQIVASLCIDADADFKKQAQHWPLYMDIQGTILPVTLNFGDLVIFHGHDTEHWRSSFTGEWYASAIFAFVEKEGPWAFQKYDQRKQLGMPHVGMFHWSYGCIKQSIRRRLKS